MWEADIPSLEKRSGALFLYLPSYPTGTDISALPIVKSSNNLCMWGRLRKGDIEGEREWEVDGERDWKGGGERKEREGDTEREGEGREGEGEEGRVGKRVKKTDRERELPRG